MAPSPTAFLTILGSRSARALVVVLATCLIVALATEGHPQGPEAVVAAWNVAAGRSDSGGVPIPADRLARIAEVIRQLDPDVIVLSEVFPDQAAVDLVALLGPAFQPPVALPQKPGVVQNLAILSKTSVQVTDAALIPDSDLPDEATSRRALSARVKIGQFDFILIGVHLKSGRAQADREKRDRQVKAIAEFVRGSVAGSEKDALIVGDYNMVPSQDQQNFTTLNPDGLLRFVSSESLGNRWSHRSSCQPPRGNLLDGFAIARQHTGEFVAGSVRLLRFGDLGSTCSKFALPSSSTYVSDHLPLTVRRLHRPAAGSAGLAARLPSR
jgi:endonuclease/exonuclease/phosphatase family metal-dependent hydrolase